MYHSKRPFVWVNAVVKNTVGKKESVGYFIPLSWHLSPTKQHQISHQTPSPLAVQARNVMGIGSSTQPPAPNYSWAHPLHPIYKMRWLD